MDDLPFAHRLQLTKDGHRAFLEAVEDAFGDEALPRRGSKAY